MVFEGWLIMNRRLTVALCALWHDGDDAGALLKAREYVNAEERAGRNAPVRAAERVSAGPWRNDAWKTTTTVTEALARAKIVSGRKNTTRHHASPTKTVVIWTLYKHSSGKWSERNSTPKIQCKCKKILGRRTGKRLGPLRFEARVLRWLWTMMLCGSQQLEAHQQDLDIFVSTLTRVSSSLDSIQSRCTGVDTTENEADILTKVLSTTQHHELCKVDAGLDAVPAASHDSRCSSCIINAATDTVGGRMNSLVVCPIVELGHWRRSPQTRCCPLVHLLFFAGTPL